MFSILHITDLHRSRTDPISNAELISALLQDRESYQSETPSIRPPDAIVVSGDVIQGVGLNGGVSQGELENQYQVAHDFLVELADRFLNGERAKIIIVPGNHDIDWNTARSAMVEESDDRLLSDLPRCLHQPNSPYRWDWRSRKLYLIKDSGLYKRRMDAFWSFFHRFYEGCQNSPTRTSDDGANLYVLDKNQICVAAFNSCEGNDCFRFQGEIDRHAIARAHLDMNDKGNWKLRIAVWHHDIEGPPHRQDYMDLDIVRGMIGRDFRLGLYGHQHKVQISPHQIKLATEETMVLASAGSLCAGNNELPTGSFRGYSIIEINDSYTGARIHVREMRVANLFSKAVLAEFGIASYVDLNWTTPVDAAGRKVNVEQKQYLDAVAKAEEALKIQKDPKRALSLLAAFTHKSNSHGRALQIAAAREVGDPQTFIDVIGEPKTIEELVSVIMARVSISNFNEARALIERYQDELHLPSQTRQDLETKISLEEKFKS